MLLVLLTPCFAHHTAVVINRNNGVENVTSTQLEKMTRGELHTWPDGKEIVLVLHSAWPGEDETLAHLNGMTPQGWKAYCVMHKARFIFVDTDDDVLRTVQAEPGAVGFIEVHSIDESIHVVRVDGKLPMEFGYLPHAR